MFFHLRRLRPLRARLGRDVTLSLVTALVISRLDYCNGVIAGLSATTVAPLQRVLHAAARLVNGTTTWRQHSSSCTGCRSSNGSTINCASLCTKWLFVKRHPTWPAVTEVPSLSTLRDASNGNYVIPRTRLKFGERRFLLPFPCMEPPANRTQADAFHAGFQAFLENVLVPDCLLYLAPESHF